MSIIRAPRPESNFYLLNKAISEDKRLSWAARGLLVFLLGKPDHWQVSVSHLRNETKACSKPTGRDGVYGLLDELIKAGYIARVQGRAVGGKMGETNYYVSESPLPSSPLPSSPDTSSPDTDSPLPAEPYPAEPYPANPTQVSNEDNQEQREATLVPASAATTDAADRIPYEAIRELYNNLLGGKLQRCLGLNDKHRKGIRACYNLKLGGKFLVQEGGLSFWEGLFNDVLDCPFLLGQNDRNWRADFAFLTTATKVQSFLEGKYDR